MKFRNKKTGEMVDFSPCLINSALLSAQNRQRYYWANWEFGLPEDKGISPSSVIEYSVEKPNSQGWQEWWIKNGDWQLKKKYSCIINNEEKAITQTARQMASWNGNLVRTNKGLRFATPIECERLQTFPDRYTAHVSNTQRYKALGNSWTVDVVAHIFEQGLK